MKKLLIFALFCIPTISWADHVDVIPAILKEGCTLQTYLANVADFNKDWGSKHAYQVEVLVPMQGNDMVTLYWLGRSENAAAFGAAFDAWSAEVTDPNSTAGKLMARFTECSEPFDHRESLISY